LWLLNLHSWSKTAT